MCKETVPLSLGSSEKPFNDVPFFSILLRPFLFAIKPIWDIICSIRWALSRPFQLPVLPFCTMPLIYPFKYIPHVCYGEILFLVPIGVIAYLSYQTSFGRPDIEESGVIAELPIIAVFLTATKSNSLITFILGIPFERLVTWHKLWGYLAVATAAMHMWCAYAIGGRRRLLEGDERFLSGDSHDGDDTDSHFGGSPTYYSLNGPSPNYLKFLSENEENYTGSIALIAMIALVVPSIFAIFRRWFFELWYIPHVISAMVALIFAIIHGAGTVVFVLIWWGIDLATRYILMAGFLYPHKASLRSLPGEIVELSFPKPANFEYDAGQFVMIAVPKLGFASFHPFTVSSAPHQNTVTMHIKVLGNWTRRLEKLARKGGNEVSILIEGPYSKLAVDINDEKRYKMVMLVSGGIGVTPMYSIGNDLIHQMENSKRDIKKMKFIWCIRSMDLLDSMIDAGSTHFDNRTIFDADENEAVELDIYLTKRAKDIENDKVSLVKIGRPNFDRIFKNMQAAALNENEGAVAVLACGPGPMIDSVRDACRKWSNMCGGVKFDFHEETFEL
jgi:predicted ferric reductase